MAFRHLTNAPPTMNTWGRVGSKSTLGAGGGRAVYVKTFRHCAGLVEGLLAPLP